MQILIVDDDDISLALLKRALTDCGNDVQVAYDGAEALEMIQRDSIRVVISDWVMPGKERGSSRVVTANPHDYPPPPRAPVKLPQSRRPARSRRPVRQPSARDLPKLWSCRSDTH